MSTDYGLKCLDCNTSIVPDNFPFYAIEGVFKNVHALANLWRAANAIKGVAQIYLSADWLSDGLDDFLKWVDAHHTHRLVVVDEYGNEHPKLGRTL